MSKKYFLHCCVLIFALICTFYCCAGGYPTSPVGFTSVEIKDQFWSPRLECVRAVTIPLALDKCEESGRFRNFIKASHPSDDNVVDCNPYDDTDVYKVIEAASYLLHCYADSALEARVDSIISMIAKAQSPDGYLMTAYLMNPNNPHPWIGKKRWEKVEELSHEFYNLGHLIEGAVAHYHATHKNSLLDVARKYADCVCREIGIREGQADHVPGHQIVEMALARFYLVTGEQKYLDQARYFLDRRGYTERKDSYSQAHQPVTEQSSAVGHAVRAMYMYSGMADVGALTGDSMYIAAVDRLWDNIVEKKYYITGGIGARHEYESFGEDYELPDFTAYCETCASIGYIFFNHRMFLLHKEAKYYDVLERTLYNGVLAGISLKGDEFFYPNPLASDGGYSRKPWFGTACCPSNLCRFLPSLPGYIYATDDEGIYVNLYIGNESLIDVSGRSVKISQTGNYIQDGKVSLSIEDNHAGEFTLRLRIPGWAQNSPVPSNLYSYCDENKSAVAVSLNGKPLENYSMDKGYLCITNDWEPGSRVDINFGIRPRLVSSNEHVADYLEKVAVERGPIVYCVEWPDNSFDISQVEIVTDEPLQDKGLDSTGRYVEVTAIGQLPNLLSDGINNSDKVSVTFIPYYAWANRGEGKMRVWIPGAE